MNKHILIVEDGDALAAVLRDNLTFEGFRVDCAPDGSAAIELVAAVRPDLVLLDVMMPGLDGFEVCRTLNVGQKRVPIIMLTARGQKQDKVRGLQIGADDYVTKPFSFDELLARIHAVLRRTSVMVPAVTLGDIRIDFGRMHASRGDTPLSLTAREFAILQHLAERPGRVVSREELLRAVWGYREARLTRTVDNFVARLRRKIEENPHHPRYIQTVHGDGYRLAVDVLS